MGSAAKSGASVPRGKAEKSALSTAFKKAWKPTISSRRMDEVVSKIVPNTQPNPRNSRNSAFARHFTAFRTRVGGPTVAVHEMCFAQVQHRHRVGRPALVRIPDSSCVTQVNSDGPSKDIRVTLQTADRLVKTNPLICFEPIEDSERLLGRYSLWTVPCKKKKTRASWEARCALIEDCDVFGAGDAQRCRRRHSS